MAVTRPTYATRRMIKRATDIHTTAEFDDEVDSALDEAANAVDALCRRRFYNVTATQSWDWPNFQYAYPWRIWFDERELADVTTTVPVVTTGGVTIPATAPDGKPAIFWGPWNYAPPFTFMELNRAESYAYGVGTTPQRDVQITGVFGYWTKSRPAGALAAAISDTTSTGITVTDSSQVDVGDVVTVGSESMLVTDAALVSTGQSQTGSGCSTASEADNLLTVADGTQLHNREIVHLDGESMLITAIAGNVATVSRAYDGTVLATHTSAAVWAYRALTVTRGDFGSTAATHTNGSAVTAAVVPGLVRELARAEAINTVFQITSAYARTIGENSRPVPGGSLPDLRDRCWQAFGRKHRSRVI